MDQNFANKFWKGSPKEQSCKLFQNVTSSFKGEELYRISQGTILWNYSIFWPAVSEKFFFLRISSCPYSAKNLFPPPPPPPPPHDGYGFRRIKISQTIFEKGHTRNNPVKLFQIRTNGFRGEDFQKNCLKNSIWLPWQPEFLMDLNSANMF